MPKAVPIFKNFLLQSGYFKKKWAFQYLAFLLSVALMQIGRGLWPSGNRFRHINAIKIRSLFFIFFKKFASIKSKNLFMAHLFWRITLFLIPISAFSQPVIPKKYPRNYFRNPLNIPISLAANFGELRPNHYHMGLDIKTQKRENLPVYSAADGYIARIRIEPFGFGQAIYVNHPNGYTTLYAHLNDFFPALAAYIKKQQYIKEEWSITLNIPPNLFTVKKGQLIAYSGNRGGSQGPHLHFEIRSTADELNLNPMLFGLPIPDNTVPQIQKLAIYDGNKSIYEQSPELLNLHKTGKDFSITGDSIICSSSRPGFGITAFDTQSGSDNPNGIYQADLFDNGQWIIGFRMDSISYDYTNGVNAHIDYKTRANGGPYLQQLFQLPGYQHSIYRTNYGDGHIDISDGSYHSIRIEVKDAYGNRSALKFILRYKENNEQPLILPGKTFYPQMLDVFEKDDCAFYIGEKCLYDSVHINYSNYRSIAKETVSLVHTIGAEYIPLQEPVLIRIKPFRDFPAEKKDKVLMQWFSNNSAEVHKVEWQGGWASSKFRQFGNFQLILDEEPPMIRAIGLKEGASLKKAARIVIEVKDNQKSIKHFRALLDGHWLRFTNDKEKDFIYTLDEHCPPGHHELTITAEDEAGNISTRIFSF
jgi:Peptidase family M23